MKIAQCVCKLFEKNSIYLKNGGSHTLTTNFIEYFIKSKKFDIIMANINRNVLLIDIPVYSACLNPKGFLFLSGFYKRDLPAIQEVCECLDLRKESQIIRNDWVAVKYKSN